MNIFFARFFKSNQITLFHSIFSLFLTILIITPFFSNNIFLSNKIPDNLAWAQIDPNQDSDGDGISDMLELQGDPNNDRDTDGDNIKDFLDRDTCTMPTATGTDSISLQLWLYKCDPNCVMEDPNIIYFTGCRAIGIEDVDIPSSYGDFPYGLWGLKVNLKEEVFKHDVHKIKMEIFFPGRINPLNAQYWAQEYNNDQKRVEWKEYNQDDSSFFDPNITKRSVTIMLSDSRPSKSQPSDFEHGFGDQDPNEWIIDHVGGLLWPIPGEGWCFIDCIWSKKPL